MIEIFFDFEIGNIKNVRVKAKPKWMALAGSPLNIPMSNIKGNGDAYQSWNKVQMIAIVATTFMCKPVRFLVGDKSSPILFFISALMFWFILEKIHYYKKKGPKNIGPFNLIMYLDYINPASL